MKLDADEKDILESVSRANGGRRREANGNLIAIPPTRGRRCPQGSPIEYPYLKQGSGGDSEARAGGGPAVPDAHREFAPQVRLRVFEGGLAIRI